MFGFGKDKKKGKAAAKSGGKPTREELQQQAIANMRKAREEIGEENVQRMAEALKRLENPQKMKSEAEIARDKIRKMDSGRVADEIKWLMEDKDKS